MSPPPPAEPPVVTPQLLRGWPLPELDDEGTKHDRGTLLVVGGAVSTPGAVLLAGLAALRAGAGRLQVATVRETSVQVGVALPEAMVVGLPGLAASAADLLAERADGAAAVVLGPGLLSIEDTGELLSALLPQLSGPLVLDAIALKALAGRPELLRGLRDVILTPNSGELAGLLGDDELEGREAAARVASTYGAVVVTQGWVVGPDGSAWQSGNGGVGLGTSGSGDVLAGVVGGLLARGAEPAQAGVWGQYAHAAAGDQLAARTGRVGFLARELLDEVPSVLASLQT